jgi:hypothetical protein
MKPLRLLVLLTLFLSGICSAQDIGNDLRKLENRGIKGYFEKDQEVGCTGKVYQKYLDGKFGLKG